MTIKSLEIKQLDNEKYLLIGTDEQGQNLQLPLSEGEIVFLSQCTQCLARGIAIKKAEGLSGIQLSFSLPLEKFDLSTDLNTSNVLLRLYDVSGLDTGYSLEPAHARQLGERLIARADAAEKILESVTTQ
jgi:hypothetical protein